MTFSLLILLYSYYVIVAIWSLFFLIAIFHVIKYGLLSFTTFLAAFIFIGGAIFILNFSYQNVAPIDWQTEVSIFNWN